MPSIKTNGERENDSRGEEDDLLIETLFRYGQDHHFILQVEEDLSQFMELSHASSMEFPAGLSSYHRCLLHKVAARFQLSSESSGINTNRKTTVSKTDKSCFPCTSLHELVGKTMSMGNVKGGEKNVGMRHASAAVESCTEKEEEKKKKKRVVEASMYLPPHKRTSTTSQEKEDSKEEEEEVKNERTSNTPNDAEEEQEEEETTIRFGEGEEVIKAMGNYSNFKQQEEDEDWMERFERVRVSEDGEDMNNKSTTSQQGAKYSHNRSQSFPPTTTAAAAENILEISQLSLQTKSNDLEVWIGATFSKSSYYLKWVDHYHALVIFNTISQATRALSCLQHPIWKLKSMEEATEASKRLIGISQPCSYKRPETSAKVARRLILGSLALSEKKVKEQKDRERMELQQQHQQRQKEVEASKKPEKIKRGRGFGRGGVRANLDRRNNYGSSKPKPAIAKQETVPTPAAQTTPTSTATSTPPPPPAPTKIRKGRGFTSKYANSRARC